MNRGADALGSRADDAPPFVEETAPLVTAIIPTYNRAGFLRDAIDSVLAQSYPRMEVIVVDDGSTDETDQILTAYGASIRAIKQPNQGVGAARNAGIRAARGSLLAFLDSDDIWLPEKLSQQVALYLDHPDSGIIAGGNRYVDVDGEPLPGVFLGPDLVDYEELQIRTAIPGSGSNILIPRVVLKEVGGFDETLTRAQDRELWIRIGRRYPIRCVRAPTVLIRVHDEPRHNVDYGVILRSRQEVNRRIEDPGIRRKAQAWMWFNLGLRLLRDGRLLRGWTYAARSFLVHPGRVHPGLRRVRPLTRHILPDFAYGLIRGVLNRDREARSD